MSFRTLMTGRFRPAAARRFRAVKGQGLRSKPVRSTSQCIEAGRLGAVLQGSVPSLRAIITSGLVCALLAAAPAPGWSAVTPQGIWLIDNKVAVQIFDCSNLLCGRIVWLGTPRDAAGSLHLDKKNPDLALRPRLVCGLMILEGLQPAGPGRWKNGRFYNPDDGRQYNATAELIPILIEPDSRGFPDAGRV